MKKLTWIAGYGVVAVSIFAGIYAWQKAVVAHDRMVEQLQAICAAQRPKALEAVDFDYPHTPKCLDLDTGLMTVPREFYRARGGHL